MFTIKEVARRAGVSVGTASHVLNGKVPVSDRLRKKVEAAMRALDYHPSHVARSLSTNRTKTLGILVPDITNPFFPQIIRGAEEVATRERYSLITIDTDDRPKREKEGLSLLRSRRVDGILLVIAPGRRDSLHIKAVQKAGIPLVCLDRAPSGIEIDFVGVDNFGAAHSATRHLISMGHRKIAILTGPLSLQNARERLKGYKAGLREAGIQIVPELIQQGDFRQETGMRICQEMFVAGRQWPSALFISNNLMSLGALEALSRIGLRCPDDVALATVDGFMFPDAFHPTITTVVQAAYQIGVRGTELLLSRLRGEISARAIRIELPTELHLKESSLRAASVGVRTAS